MILGLSFLFFWDKDWIFFFFFFDIKIESLLVYSIFDCLVYPHQWSLFCLVYFPFDCWHSRLGCLLFLAVLVGLVDVVTPTTKLMVQKISWLKEVLQVEVPWLKEVLQVDGMRRFLKLCHFSSLGSCFIIYDTCCD